MTSVVKAVVFDFDGVILDSNGIKRQAYFGAVGSMFPGCEEIVDGILFESRPTPRKLTMTRIVEAIATIRPAQVGSVGAIVDILVDAYGREVDTGLLAAPFLPGALDALICLSARLPIYLNTLNPEDRILEVLRRRGIAQYFSGVFGSEKSKIENLSLVISKHGPGPELVVVGDGVLDWESARVHQAKFIAVNMKADAMAAYPAVAHVSDLIALPDLIDRM